MKGKQNPGSRRKFVKSIANSLAIAGTLSLPEAFSIPNYIKKMPSNTVRLGAIGVKGIGWANIQAFKKHIDAEIVGFADIDQNVNNQRKEEYSKNYKQDIQLYSDYRKLLENKDIDAVIINTPDHWHTLQLVHALESGKHAYTEKPLANSIEECLLLEKAVAKYGKVVQVGQQQRSGHHFKDAIKWLNEGQLGKIRHVRCWIFNGNKGTVPKIEDEAVPQGVDYEAWLGPAPARNFNKNHFHFTFRWFWDYAGGLMTDWGVHLLDVALWGMSNPSPISISAQGGKFAFPDDAMQTPDTLMASYQFPDFLLTWEHTIGIGRGPFDKGHGIAFYGENGTLFIDRQGWEVIPEFKKDSHGLKTYKTPPLPFQAATGDDRYEHTRNFLDAIKSGVALACPVEIGSKAAIVAHLGNVAFRSGETIRWDSTNKKIISSVNSQKFGLANYRKPYLLPKI
jgi:predicted dehydrogenase